MTRSRLFEAHISSVQSSEADFIKSAKRKYFKERPLNRDFVNSDNRYPPDFFYVDVLPRIDGLDFIQILQKQLKLNYPVRKTDFLDIGCGHGIALLNLRTIFPFEQLTITGVGNIKDTETYYTSVITGKAAETTKPKLLSNNIKFINGNFVRSKELGLQPNSFDMITSVFTLGHINYPHILLLNKIWSLLRPGGYAFLNYVPMDLPDETTLEADPILDTFDKMYPEGRIIFNYTKVVLYKLKRIFPLFRDFKMSDWISDGKLTNSIERRS